MTWGLIGRVIVGITLVAGCVSTPDTTPSTPDPAAPAPGAPAPTAGSAEPILREDKDLERVWLVPGFRFSGYDALYVVETRTDVPRLHPDGMENLQWARGVVRDELVGAIGARKLFGTVIASEADLRPGVRALRLENTIIEYEKGGGGARYWAGLYGAGQPVIKVRGRVADGDRAVFLFETRRSGVSGKARWLGAYMSDKDIQTEDIRSLAKAVAEFMAAPR
ncbi:MAG: hypothetical protein ACRELA_02915 [Candidatus Rokuibacteriota bacterium]